jgi:hypothetical protein
MDCLACTCEVCVCPAAHCQDRHRPFRNRGVVPPDRHCVNAVQQDRLVTSLSTVAAAGCSTLSML